MIVKYKDMLINMDNIAYIKIKRNDLLFLTVSNVTIIRHDAASDFAQVLFEWSGGYDICDLTGESK